MGWRVCNVTHERCPELTDDPSGKCDAHQAEARRASDAKRPTSSARGYDERWRKTRAAYLRRYPDCQEPGCTAKATDVDHVDELGPKGPRGHEWANLRGYCHSHHSKRTARDQPAGWNRARRGNAKTPFYVLAGRAGAGKSALRDALAPRLGATSLGRDDFAHWNDLYDVLDHAPCALVECCRIPRALRRKIAERGATVIELTATLEQRRQRLTERGERPATIAQRLGEDGSLGYEDPITPDLSVQADRPPDELATSIVNALGLGTDTTAAMAVLTVAAGH